MPQRQGLRDVDVSTAASARWFTHSDLAWATREAHGTMVVATALCSTTRGVIQGDVSIRSGLSMFIIERDGPVGALEIPIRGTLRPPKRG
jgi:hypothetical protein